jgi:alpha-mannosidase
VPALGWKRVQLRRAERASPERVQIVEAGSADASIACGECRVAVRRDGCVDLDWGAHAYRGLFAVEDLGDRGDSYDFDRAGEDEVELAGVAVERARHPSGIARLRVVRRLRVPARLEVDRETRSRDRAELVLATELRIAPGVPRADVDVRLVNTARDHRLRLLFPLGADAADLRAATTFDVVARRAGADPRAAGVHPAPSTFPFHGFARAGALAIAAWGLNEAELLDRPSGAALAITLVRCVGSLSRGDLRSRPGPAGPGLATPRAQCEGELRARMALFVGAAERELRAAELGLRAVPAGAQQVAPAQGWVELAPDELVLSALKPSECGAGFVARVLNPTDRAVDARLRVAVPFDRAAAVRLDETELPDAIERRGEVLEFPVPAHALRSVWLV